MSLAKSPINVLDVQKTEFRGSLRRSFVVWILVLTLIPILLIIATNYFTSRGLISDQVSSQLQTIASNSSKQIEQVGAFIEDYLAEMLSSPTVAPGLANLLLKPTSQSIRFSTNIKLFSYIQGKRDIGGTRVDHILVVDNTGKVIAATNNAWQDQDYSQNQFIMDLLGKERTLVAFDVAPFYPKQLAFYSSRILVNLNNDPVATLILTATSNIPGLTIASASSFFPLSRAYYFTSDSRIIELSAENNGFNTVLGSTNFENSIKSMMSENGISKSYQSTGNLPVLGYGLWMPDLSLGIVIEAREDIIYQQINSQLPFTFLLVILALVATTAVVLIGSNRLVQPLVQLAQSGRSISQGNINEPILINRNDEIGVILTSFNDLAGQVKNLESTLESQVEKRTEALRTATEIARQSTSTTQRQVLIDRTCQQLIDKLGFSFASMYILDESKSYAILEGTSKVKNSPKIPENYRLNVAADSLVGWVALNGQMRAVQDFNNEPAFRSLLTTDTSRSEIAIPIHAVPADGNDKTRESDVIGVLSIQSSTPNAFDESTAGALGSLAAQIASGIQNIQAFESTEENLEELNKLYTTSKEIVQASNEKEMIQILSRSLAQTNYVSGIFSVEPLYLSVLGIIDPRSPSVTSAQGITLPLQKIGQKVEPNSMVLVEYLTQPTEFDNLLSFFSRRGCHSAALFFVFNKENLSKIFVIGSRDLNPLQPEQMQPYLNLVGVMSTTLEHFQTMNLLEQRIGELQTLAQVSKAISAETDLNQLYKLLHEEISQAFGSDVHFLVATYDEETNFIKVPYIFDGVSQLTVEPFPLGEGMTSILIRNREPLLLVKDTERKAAELGAKIVGKTAKSWLGVPLVVGGRVLGALILQDTEKEERFTENDLRLMITLSSPVANAIRNAQLLTQMQEALRAYDQERFLLNVLLDNIPDLIYFKDPQGKFIRASKSTVAAFGLSTQQDLNAKTVFELGLSEEIATKAASLEEEIAATQESKLNEMIQYNPGQENEKWALVSKIPLYDAVSKQLAGLLGIESDITPLKRTEQIAQRRAQQIRTASEIARDTTTELNVSEILNKSINLIRERFGFYHASIFLLDPLKEYAVLRDSTGEVGQIMKERGHRLAVGSQSIVGRATANRKPLVINDVTQDPNYFANPLLPDTRSELAIPLQVGSELMGAIDVQSNRLNAFTDEDVNILQILADQLAVAVLNANLFTEAKETLDQHKTLHDITNEASAADTKEKAVEIITRALHKLRETDRVCVFLMDTNNQLVVQASIGYDNIDLSNLRIHLGEGIVGKVAQERRPIRVDDTSTTPEYMAIDPEIRSELAVPILYGDRLMGVVDLENPTPAAYDENDQEIIATLGTNLGTILTNTQLVSEVRQQVERQRQLYEITSKIRRSVDIQTILQTFTSEVCNAMQARRAKVQITAGLSPEEAVFEIPKGSSQNGDPKVEEL